MLVPDTAVRNGLIGLMGNPPSKKSSDDYCQGRVPDHLCHIWRMLLVFSGRKRTKGWLSILGEIIIEMGRKDVTRACIFRKPSFCRLPTTQPPPCPIVLPPTSPHLRLP